MRLFGYDITRASRSATVAAPVRGTGGWWPVVREPYTGAWQKNEELRIDGALANPTVFACTTLISSDIGKLRLRLVEQTAEGIWVEASSNAFSPVLRKPNGYQTIVEFVEQWILAKLNHGNAYVLKQRDGRGVVIGLYLLDPQRVTPLVAPDGAVYYELKRDDLSGLPAENPVVVPASEIIHDKMYCLFHPLVGVSPIFAAAVPALQGLKIQEGSTAFFSGGSRPGGVLLVPGDMEQAEADQAKARFEERFSGANAGRIAVLTNGMTYTPVSFSAVDSQLIEQLKWATETICSCYHVPAALIDSSHQPPYANSEPLMQQYYSQCLQTVITKFETALDEGLGLIGTIEGKQYGTEFDIDDLIWMDTATRTKAAHESIAAGALAPNESRKKYFGVGSVPGGDSPYLQQQYYSLAALAARDAAAGVPATPPLTLALDDIERHAGPCLWTALSEAA